MVGLELEVLQEEEKESIDNVEIRDDESISEPIEEMTFLKDFPKMKKRNAIILEVVLVTFFTLLSFGLAMSFLSGDMAAGMDGGYYELQVKTLIEEGQLYFESPFLSYLVMALFALISGNVTFGVYFSASLFLAAAVVSCYFAARIIWNRKVAILTLPFAALSTILLRTSTDLIKNLLALVFIPLAIAYFNQFHVKRTWKSLVLSLLFSGLTISSHLMTTLTLTVCFVGYFTIYTIITIIADRKFDWKKHFSSIGILVASAVVMLLFWVITEYAMPVKETYWDYSSNEIPDGSSSYLPSDEGFILPIRAFFYQFLIFENIIAIVWLVISIVLIAFTKSVKERNGVIMLYSMLFSVLLLGISVDVNSWLFRMQLDAAPFLILCGAFTCSFLVLGLERFVKWIDKKAKKINLQKIRPKITVPILIMLILISPMIFSYIRVGNSFNPIINSEEANDLINMKGQLPQNDSFIIAKHGLEYWTAYYSGYQVEKLDVPPNALGDLYNLLNNSSPKAYYINYLHNPFIPMVMYDGNPYTGESFVFNNPLNGSVQMNPVIISFLTAPNSSVVDIGFRLFRFTTGELLVENHLANYTLISGESEWNYTLPIIPENEAYILDFRIISITFPFPPKIEFVRNMFSISEMPFRAVYIGNIFGVVEVNPNFNSSMFLINNQIMEEPPDPPPPPTGELRFNILTFMLKLQIPVLTGYFHYYLVIPITIVYWTLLLTGSSYLIKFAYHFIKKRKKDVVEIEL